LVAYISTMFQAFEHQRLGHPTPTKMRLMLPNLSYTLSFLCESFQLGKHTRHTYGTQVNKNV